MLYSDNECSTLSISKHICSVFVQGKIDLVFVLQGKREPEESERVTSHGSLLHTLSMRLYTIISCIIHDTYRRLQC